MRFPIVLFGREGAVILFVVVSTLLLLSYVLFRLGLLSGPLRWLGPLEAGIGAGVFLLVWVAFSDTRPPSRRRWDIKPVALVVAFAFTTGAVVRIGRSREQAARAMIAESGLRRGRLQTVGFWQVPGFCFMHDRCAVSVMPVSVHPLWIPHAVRISADSVLAADERWLRLACETADSATGGLGCGGTDSVATGDTLFDRVFAVSTSNAAWACALLVPEVRRALLRYAGFHEGVAVEAAVSRVGLDITFGQFPGSRAAFGVPVGAALAILERATVLAAGDYTFGEDKEST